MADVQKKNKNTSQYDVAVSVTYWVDGTTPMADLLCGGLYNKSDDGTYFMWAHGFTWNVSKLTIPSESNFKKLVADFGSGNGFIIVDVPVNFTTSYTIPSNITLQYTGGYFTGVQPTINAVEISNRNSLWVEDFRTPNDSDNDVWDKAVAEMQATQKPLFVEGRSYIFTRSVIIGSGYCVIYGQGGRPGVGTIINGAISGFEYIGSSAVSADMAIPVLGSYGPLRGSAFIISAYTDNLIFKNLTFSNFRFATSFFDISNNPKFIGCSFQTVNICGFHYRGCQNMQYINCVTILNTGNLHVSSATCFPVGSPYEFTDMFTDGLGVKNLQGYGALQCIVNPNFDNWFRDSIFRPTVPSQTLGPYGPLTYGYDPTNYFCLPSGRAVYVPVRNPRISFGVYFENLDIRIGMPRGFAFINTGINMFVLSGVYACEEMFSTYNNPYGETGVPSYDIPMFMLGTASGTIGPALLPVGNDDGKHMLIDFTGDGGSGSTREDGLMLCGTGLGEDKTLAPRKYLGGFSSAMWFPNAVLSSATMKQPINFNSLPYGAILQPLNLDEGQISLGQKNGNKDSFLHEGCFLRFWLPYNIGGAWRNSSTLDLPYRFTGNVKIEVFNVTKDRSDVGEFYIDSGADETRTNTSAINNGDQVIHLDTIPASFQRAGMWLIATGVYVRAEYFDGADMYLTAPVSGLSAPVSIGSNISKTLKEVTIRDFQYDDVTFGFGVTAYSIPTTLGIVNNKCAYDDITGDMIFVIITLSHHTGDLVNYSIGLPTTISGYKIGARLKEANSVVGGFADYILTSSGWMGINPIGMYVPAPSSSTSPGIAGQEAYDSSNFYKCVATNTWLQFIANPIF